MISLKQANLLINKKLVFNYKLKKYKLFHKECKVTQYFNYYKYSHIIKVCCKEKKYGIYIISGHNN